MLIYINYFVSIHICVEVNISQEELDDLRELFLVPAKKLEISKDIFISKSMDLSQLKKI